VNVFGYLVALLAGMIASRTSTVMMRGGYEETNTFRSFVGLLSMIATFGLISLGFVLFEWWVPIVAFIGISILMDFLVTRQTLGAFCVAIPIFGIISTAGCAYGWYAWTVI
jgi:type II secretory pathway component PulF